MTTIVYQRSFYADTAGKPLDSGSLYIGAANQDPETSPLSVFWDEALTLPATQPLQITAGYVVNNGARAAFYVAQSDYSLRIRSRSGALIDYYPNNSTIGGANQIDYSPSATYDTGTVGAAIKDVSSIYANQSGIYYSSNRFAYGLQDVLQTLWGPGFENNTRFFVGNPIGRAAVATFTRSSDNPTTGDMSTYAVGAFTEHDSDKYAYGQYTEVRRRSGAGAAHGQEIALINFGATVDVDPYNPYAAGLTDVLRLSTGRTDTASTDTDVSAFIDMVTVGGATALRGINIGSDALKITGGQGDAINLATGHAIQWYSAAGTRSARIRSDGGAYPMALIFANNIVAFQNSALANVLTIEPTRLTMAGPVKTGIYTVATLPTGQQGDRAFVTDATATTYASVAAGGGANKVPVFHDGSTWRVG